jgi:hypothetical protein
MNGSLFERLVQLDQARRSFPGEHWAALAAGLWFFRRRGKSLPGRMLSKAIGAALIVRAASGRDGLRKLWENSPGQGNASLNSSGLNSAANVLPPRSEALPMQDEPAVVSGSSPRAALLQAPDPASRMPPESASSVRSGGFPDFR